MCRTGCLKFCNWLTVSLFCEMANWWPSQADETDESDLVSLMVGRELSEFFEQRVTVRDEVALKVEGLTTYRISNVSFEVRKGEVVGFAGLVGAGRTDLAKALMGEESCWPARSSSTGNRSKSVTPIRHRRWDWFHA